MDIWWQQEAEGKNYKKRNQFTTKRGTSELCYLNKKQQKKRYDTKIKMMIFKAVREQTDRQQKKNLK